MAHTAILIFIIGLLHLHYCLSSESEEFKDYQKAGLENHNNRRKCHNAPPLKLSHAMNLIAECCAHFYLREGESSRKERDCSRSGLPGWFMIESSHIMPIDNKDFSSLVRAACDYWYKLCPKLEAKDLVHDGSFDIPRVWDFGYMVWKRHEVLGIGVATNGTRAAIVSVYRFFERDAKPGDTNIDAGGCCSGDSSGAKYRFCLNHIMLGVAIFTNCLLAYFP